MTGRELILYILENGLEDEEVIKDDKILGFMTVGQVAIKAGVGTATVKAWIVQQRLPYLKIGNVVYIPANAEIPMKTA